MLTFYLLCGIFLLSKDKYKMKGIRYENVTYFCSCFFWRHFCNEISVCFGWE
nr:MAG TPA: hypothetical protein [Caudoviricetes sp.]